MHYGGCIKLVKMTWTTIDALNQTDLRDVLQYPNLEFPFLWVLVLFAFFTIVTLASYFSEKERIGRGNFLSSLAVGSFVSVIFALLMRLLSLIDKTTLIIAFVLMIIFVAIYYFSDQ